MPRNQSRAAKKARAIQRATGQKYTKALRSVTEPTPIRGLAAALRKAGLTDLSDQLNMTAAWSEGIAEIDAVFDQAEQLRYAAYETETLTAAQVGAIEAAAKAAGDALSDAVNGDYFREDHELLRASAVALAHAAADSGDADLVHAAARAVNECSWEASWAADAIRGGGLLELPAPGSLASLPFSAAHEAATALAEAAAIPFGDDEHWTQCTELLEEAFQALKIADQVWGDVPKL